MQTEFLNKNVQAGNILLHILWHSLGMHKQAISNNYRNPWAQQCVPVYKCPGPQRRLLNKLCLKDWALIFVFRFEPDWKQSNSQKVISNKTELCANNKKPIPYSKKAILVSDLCCRNKTGWRAPHVIGQESKSWCLVFSGPMQPMHDAVKRLFEMGQSFL